MLFLKQGTVCNKWLKEATAVERIDGTFWFSTHKYRSKKERKKLRQSLY